MLSTRVTLPSSVSNVVSSTSVSPRYRRDVRFVPGGPMRQKPFSSSPRSAAKQAGESNRGTQNQSIEPSRQTNAAVCRSPMRA